MVKNILEDIIFQSRVSSVLNKDASQFGKLLMFDGNEDTCWCSDKDSPQWVAIQWENPLRLSSFHIQFQGGFVGQDCHIVVVTEDNKKIEEPFYPDDINSVQKFSLQEPLKTKYITIRFNSSTDFFGRIVIYKLMLFSDDSV